MKRAMTVTALVAMGILVASSFTAAQDAPATTSGGQITIGALGAPNVGSSKFQEYREVPKGISIPFLNLFSTTGDFDFNLTGHNVRQTDQRYNGWLNTKWFGIAFDYNQIPHNLGNDGHSIFTQAGEGVWVINDSTQRALMSTIDAIPSAGRTYDVIAGLMAPTLAATNSIDISGIRKRGTTEVTFGGGSAPYDLAFTYMREVRTGAQGVLGATMYTGLSAGTINVLTQVPDTLNALTQDFGVRGAYNFKSGNVHAAFNRSVYNNRAETTTVDNPLQAYDVAWANNTGGGARNRWIGAPDNEASTASAGVLFKFARQTRLSGDAAFATWTQNAPFYPYTINSAIFTGSGQPANATSSLPQSSFNGKINTTTLNVSFVSRPVPGLGVRLNYRGYDLTNKTNRFVASGHAGGNSPERNWEVLTATSADPYGQATANVYDSATKRFKGSVSYDVGDLTLEGTFHSAKLTRTSREAESGKDTGFGLAAVYRSTDWLRVIAKFDGASRTAEGETIYGFQSDEAKRDTTRAAIEVEVSPTDTIDVSFSYGLRDVKYPDRPNRVAVANGVPVPGQGPYPGTPSGLLGAKYDTYTVEFDWTPSARGEIGAYYTYEKDKTENQWSTTNAAALGYGINNLLNYKGTDKTDTFGVNGRYDLVPEKCAFVFNVMRQKVDGLMDVTANETGTFYNPGRTTLIAAGQGGARDIDDWDDTRLTTITAQFDYNVAKAWTASFGYWYEKYDFADAYTSGTSLMPINYAFMLKPNSGAYTANVVYGKLTYRF